MTKYPIKHTMEFGEETCEKCEGMGTYSKPYQSGNGWGSASYKCPECKGEGTIPLSVTFDLIKDCPGCGGSGLKMGDKAGIFRDNTPCHHCSDNGLPAGKVHRYWTPKEAAEHIKKETGIDWEWDRAETPVYFLDELFSKWKCSQLWAMNKYFDTCVIRLPCQPAPPADYRPEET